MSGSDDLTLSSLLARDSCVRLLAEFNEQWLQSCHHLILIWETEDGDIRIVTSDNCDTVRACGLVALAHNLVAREGHVE